MHIVLLALTSDDVGESVREMQVRFGDALQAELDRASIDSGLKTIYVSPIITRAGIGPFPDKISYLRSEPAINVSINVPYEQWRDGSGQDRMTLMAESVATGITRIRESRLAAEARAAILRAVETTRRTLIGQASGAGR